MPAHRIPFPSYRVDEPAWTLTPIDPDTLRSEHLSGIHGERLDTAIAYCLDWGNGQYSDAVLYQEWDEHPYWTLAIADRGDVRFQSMYVEEGSTPTDDDIDDAINEYLIDRMYGNDD